MISAFWPLALFFSFSSFAFGCMEPWAIATCEVILFLGAAIAGWRRPDFWQFPRLLRWPALLIVALLSVGIVQSVPLPASWWRAAGAERVAVYDRGADVEKLLGRDEYRRDPFGPQTPLVPEPTLGLASPAPRWLPASFAPGATLRALLALAGAFSLILLLEALAREGSLNVKRLGQVVGLIGILLGLVAFIQYLGPQTHLMGLRATKRAAYAFGPFVNRNHGTAFFNLAMPFLYAWLWRAAGNERRRSNRLGFRFVIAGVVAAHSALAVASQSRGAILTVALFPLALLIHAAGAHRSRLARVCAILYATALIGTGYIGFAAGILRDSTRSNWCNNIPITHPLLGHGLGSFVGRFPSVASDLPLSGLFRPYYLENEYLQSFFEGGVIPCAFALLVAAWVFKQAWDGAAQKGTGFWFATAVAAETLRASVDFSAHVFPLVGVFLLGCLFLRRRADRAPKPKGLAA